MQGTHSLPGVPTTGPHFQTLPLEKAVLRLPPALLPRGNTGDSFPRDMPDLVEVFFQADKTLTTQVDRLSESYIIDARLVDGHNLPHLNSNLTRAHPLAY
jgi:5-methylthioribose kinase